MIVTGAIHIAPKIHPEFRSPEIESVRIARQVGPVTGEQPDIIPVAAERKAVRIVGVRVELGLREHHIPTRPNRRRRDDELPGRIKIVTQKPSTDIHRTRRRIVQLDRVWVRVAISAYLIHDDWWSR